MIPLLHRLRFSLFYLSDPPWDTGISPPELIDFISKHPPGRALDLGCGTGTNVITLAQAGWQATGVDFIPRAIRIAKRKARQAGVQADFRVGDASDLKGIEGPFDLALDIGCYHSLGEKKTTYLRRLASRLAPGGHWLMYGFFNLRLLRSNSGLSESDLALASDSFSLVWRQDGTERGARPSAWFLYRNTARR